MKYGKLTLGQVEAIVNKLGGEEGVRCFLAGEVVVEEPIFPLLEFISKITVSVTKTVIAKTVFVKDVSKKAKVRVSYLGPSFENLFLVWPRQIEDPIGETTLNYHKLTKDSLDAPIIALLGGKAKAETTLAEVYALMVKQGEGQGGALLTNGYGNIFYVLNNGCVLCAVIVYWNDDGWLVESCLFEYRHWWRAGYRVFSRTS